MAEQRLLVLLAFAAALRLRVGLRKEAVRGNTFSCKELLLRTLHLFIKRYCERTSKIDGPG